MGGYSRPPGASVAMLVITPKGHLHSRKDCGRPQQRRQTSSHSRCRHQDQRHRVGWLATGLVVQSSRLPPVSTDLDDRLMTIPQPFKPPRGLSAYLPPICVPYNHHRQAIIDTPGCTSERDLLRNCLSCRQLRSDVSSRPHQRSLSCLCYTCCYTP